MIIFLDFDGVLHHEKVTIKRLGQTARMFLKPHEARYLTKDGNLVCGKDLFEHAERLANVLQPYPDIKIVISSTWRGHFSIETIKSFLPASLASRVVGITPIHYRSGDDGMRLHEIQIYLKENELTGEQWIAIDDNRRLFYDYIGAHSNLFLIEDQKGFNDDAAAAFAEILRKHYGV